MRNKVGYQHDASFTLGLRSSGCLLSPPLNCRAVRVVQDWSRLDWGRPIHKHGRRGPIG